MIIAKNDEEKRSKVWRVVTMVTTVLIIIIAAFFIMKLFTSNPLEGTWYHDESNMQFIIKSNNSLEIRWPELLEGENIKIEMNYTLDKEAKTITIKADEAELKKVAEKTDGQFTVTSLEAALSSVTTTFDYNVEKSKLTLTEREYGEQMIFEKK